MQVYNETDVCENLSIILDEARKHKKVMIKSKDGELFILGPASRKGSAYNLPDLDLGLDRDEIVGFIREVRER